MVERCVRDAKVAGSNPVIPIFFNRGVAQLVARLLWEQDVGGSSPFTPISTHGGLAQLVRVLA